jgi:hypothetical protein
MYELTVGIFPRERFSTFERCLSALIRNTAIPYKLIVIDCNMPNRYRQRIARAIRGIADAKVIRLDHYALPNESRNLVFEAADTDYVCLLESDVLLQKDALKYMLETAKATGAAAVRPTLYQRRGIIHFDRWLGEYSPPTGDEKGCVTSTTDPAEYALGDQPRPATWSEMHCNLIHRPSARDVFPLDKELSEPEHVDFSLRLRAANASLVYEPRAVARIILPPPVKRDELAYFRFRWDLEKAYSSYRRLRERWNIKYRGAEEWIPTIFERESWLPYIRMRFRTHVSGLTRKLRRGQ